MLFHFQMFNKDTEVSKFARENACVVRLPGHFVELLLLIEDRRFPTHIGIDPVAMLRALRCNLLSIGLRQGASTLTQQIYNVRIMARRKGYKRTFFRKILQICFALTTGRRISKVEVLREYVHGVYWGRNLWGVEAAAKWYFKKPAIQLTVEESFYLVERLACPNRISLKRVHVILGRKSIRELLARYSSTVDAVMAMYC